MSAGTRRIASSRVRNAPAQRRPSPEQPESDSGELVASPSQRPQTASMKQSSSVLSMPLRNTLGAPGAAATARAAAKAAARPMRPRRMR